MEMTSEAGSKAKFGGPIVWLGLFAVVVVLAIALLIPRRPAGDAWLQEAVFRAQGALSEYPPAEYLPDDGDAAWRWLGEQATTAPRCLLDPTGLGWSWAGISVIDSATGDRIVSLHRGAGGTRLVAQVYRGSLADWPPADEVRHEQGRSIQLHHAGELQLAVWQQATEVVVLTAELDRETLTRLAATVPLRSP
jgi:hypothetical protein